MSGLHQKQTFVCFVPEGDICGAQRPHVRLVIGKLALISCGEMCASPRPVALFGARTSMQIINQSFRVNKIGRVETLCKPVVNRFDDGNRFSAAALIAQQAGEARRGSQLP
jgi:hypothetical protein